MSAPLEQAYTVIREGTQRQLLDLLAAFPRLIDQHEFDLLEFAVEMNQLAALSLLVSKGASVNVASGWKTILGAAASQGNVEAVEWLLGHGADINGRAEENAPTPLDEAVTSGRLEMVQLLLRRGADPNLLSGHPLKNAVATASLFGHDEIAAYLRGLGLSPVVVEPQVIDVEDPGFVRDDIRDPAAWLESKSGPVYDYGTRFGLDAMSARNQTLFLVGYLIDQMCNGGTFMVYYNPSGPYAPRMAEALDRIGATRSASIMRRINSMFPGGVPHADLATREGQIRMLPAEAGELGTELERAYSQGPTSRRGEDWITLLYNYYHS